MLSSKSDVKSWNTSSGDSEMMETGPTGDVKGWMVTGFSWDDQEVGVLLALAGREGGLPVTWADVVGAGVGVGTGRPTALAGREGGLSVTRADVVGAGVGVGTGRPTALAGRGVYRTPGETWGWEWQLVPMHPLC